MSYRANLARLKRLERQMRLVRAGVPDLSCPEFVIAPELARAIVDAHTRLHELLSRQRAHSALGHFGGLEKPDPAAEDEAAACLAELLLDVRCPADYWAKQADTDRRLWENGIDQSVQAVELFPVRARLIVFDGSSVGAVWRRMMELSYRTRTPAQQAELDELTRSYPGMPLEHYSRWYEKIRNMEEMVRKANGGSHRLSSWYEFEEALWKRVQRCREPSPGRMEGSSCQLPASSPQEGRRE
jgi:hypothetical protein